MENDTVKPEPQYKAPSKFDVLLGELRDRKHDVTETRATTVPPQPRHRGRADIHCPDHSGTRRRGTGSSLSTSMTRGSVRIPTTFTAPMSATTDPANEHE